MRKNWIFNERFSTIKLREQENNMYTLQCIKDLYYIDLAQGLTIRGFDRYLESYIRVYDENLNFLGYDKK